jgi:hypothetical protein
MFTVGGNHVIVVPQQGNRSHRDRFLADVKMKKTTHLPLAVKLKRGLLETPNAHHLAQKRDFLFGTEFRVYRRFRVIDGTGCGCGRSHSYKFRV